MSHMNTKEQLTLPQIYERLKSDPLYNEKKNILSDLKENPYYIPTLQEVREMELIEWMTPWYSDNAISEWLELVKYFSWFHEFLTINNGETMPLYPITGTFIYKPLTGYLQNCYISWNIDEVKNILIYLTEKYTPDSSDESLDFLIEGFIDGREFDDRVFRERIMNDFPEGALKEYIKTRFQDIYL